MATYGLLPWNLCRICDNFMTNTSRRCDTFVIMLSQLSHKMGNMSSPHLLAAIDLGSNSFRLEIGRETHGLITRVEYIKETVRQGAGMDADRNLHLAAMQAGWDCLSRFGERLRGFRPRQVRAVATQTLREARNADAFLARARECLGFPIEVISGPEEARLIYLGVAHLLPQSTEKRLVIDIGGRSTELILGHQLDPQVMNSYRVGSVAWSQKYFDNGILDAASFERARIAAMAILDEALSPYAPSRWEVAYGASGTVGAVVDVLEKAGWPAGMVTRDGLDWLKRTLIRAESIQRLRMEGLKEDRKAVFGGGISVLDAVMELLGIETLHASQGGLRHGVLYDMLDHETRAIDARNQTVLRLQTTFGVDAKQAQRVSKVARYFLDPLLQGLTHEDIRKQQRNVTWAAQLHEMGQAISHSDSHKHGAYILDHADVTGFAMPELHRLGLLVLGHKGKLRKLAVDQEDRSFFVQLMCLRLAVILCHARRDPDHEALTLQLDLNQDKFTLKTHRAWAEVHPQSAHLLREETLAWQKTGWELELTGMPSSI
jgi:exopolyphosphatase / guanosine-5'-triphosphate,3'-diphosphate pyrophosphatase